MSSRHVVTRPAAPCWALALAVLSFSPARAEEADGIRWNGPVPTVRLAEGGFTLRPTLRLDADAGSFFGQDEPGGYRSGVNIRRGRLGARGTLLRDFSYTFTWEFGGSAPNDYGNIYEAQVAYTGIEGATIRAGAFTLQHLPDFAGSSFDLPFLERALISNVAGSLASGTSRVALGVEGRGAIGGSGARWNASAYATAGIISTPNDDRQRGFAGRAVVLAVDRPGVQLQLGLDGAAQLHPGTNPGPESVRLRDYPELRVDSRRFLDSASIRAGSAWAAGPEVSARLGPVYLEGVWQHVAVDAVAGPDPRFEGWYVQALVPLVGAPRQRSEENGTWKRPAPAGSSPFPGALELGARFSTVDLRQGAQGSRQSILTAVLNWYPTERLRLAAQYENGSTASGQGGPGRDFQAVGLRASFNL